MIMMEIIIQNKNRYNKQIEYKKLSCAERRGNFLRIESKKCIFLLLHFFMPMKDLNHSESMNLLFFDRKTIHQYYF